MISGTPTAVGTFNFVIQITDSASQIVTKNMKIVISAFRITTASLPNGKLGNPYSKTLAATGGTTPYAWSIASGALPDGLSLIPSLALSLVRPQSQAHSALVSKLPTQTHKRTPTRILSRSQRLRSPQIQCLMALSELQTLRILRQAVGSRRTPGQSLVATCQQVSP